jgi:ABC-type Mn2+/Zn2+ transport system ATPase subunit
MIARAIVHRPRALFFDEAASALDNRAQEIIASSLERLSATRFVIAHRLSTVVNADRILNKVPEVTIFFWIVKIACTTVGQTAADYRRGIGRGAGSSPFHLSPGQCVHT